MATKDELYSNSGDGYSGGDLLLRNFIDKLHFLLTIDMTDIPS